MAKTEWEVPNELIKQFEELAGNSERMLGEMVNAGADVVYKKVKINMKKSFKDTKKLEQGLIKTIVYNTPTDDGINCHIGFYGYTDDKPTKRHPKGTPIPLIAMAREFGTSRGEKKKPFFRKSFRKKDIEEAMLKVQQKYIKEDK